ncbi:MAG: PAS domain-containing protein [Nitrospirota bacterium]|nr:PAS domain-containing protein [Nitrospirota bacterium]
MGKGLLLPEEVRALVAPLPSERGEEFPEIPIKGGLTLPGVVRAGEKTASWAPGQEDGLAGPFQRILDALGESVIATDRQGFVRYQNYSARVHLGSLEGKSWHHSIEEIERDGEEVNPRDPVEQCLSEKRPVRFWTRLLREGADSSVPVKGEAFPVFLQTGLVEGVVISLNIVL